MFCCRVDTVSSPQRIEYQQTPLKLKIIQTLGLSNFVISKFVFARPPINYTSVVIEGEERLLIEGQPFTAPYGYSYQYTILTNQTHSIPVVRLCLEEECKSTIIYSHGNSSDLSVSLRFVAALAELHKVNYIVYDYTGYGNSKLKETTPESIVQDLEMVLAWSALPLEEIILVGFSLGCFPTATVAAKHRVKGVVLLSPMASLISLFEEKLSPFTFFKQDQFNLLEVVENIESHLLIAHSRQDELIPFRHAEVIYQRYVQISKNPSIELVQLKHIQHNDIHLYLTASNSNSLQTKFLHFLRKTQSRPPASHYVYQRKKKESESEGKSRDLKELLKCDSKAKEKELHTISQHNLAKLRTQLSSGTTGKHS